MIRSFKHRGLRRFFEEGSRSGINHRHATKLEDQLSALDAASTPAQMDLPGWKLHPLRADLEGHFAICVSGNWRVTFRFDGEDAEVVDYQDYH